MRLTTLAKGAAGLVVVGGAAKAISDLLVKDDGPPVRFQDTVPSRQEQLAKLAAHGTKDAPYDVLIIGGGATGTGCAVDAVTRGLTTALVEREDFSAGTSSRSTKLVHGGVRYLEKAVWSRDVSQLKLVFEALHERARLLTNAPFLAQPLPIMTPCYKWWEVPYYWAGMKIYDLLAGSKSLQWSYYLSPSASLLRFPTLCYARKDGESLKGTIVYHDGQARARSAETLFNDARLCVTLAVTAARAGATVLNHAEVTGLIKPTEAEVQFVLDAIADYLTVRRSDVMSAWSGIRPLAMDPSAEDTASASRDHVVTVDPDGLITEAVDRAVFDRDLKGLPCVAQNYTVPHRPGAIDTRVAKYLVESYGDRAQEITRIAEERKLGRRIVRGYPILEAEALPRVVELLAKEKGWGWWRKRKELARAQAFLSTFDAPPGPAAPAPAPIASGAPA
eukprot:scaffold10.g2318.t1